MSTKTKLINNNQTLNSNNKKLMAIKNAFLRPLPEYTGSSTPTTSVDTSDANATQSDILLGKTAYVKGTKLIGAHVCSTPETEEKTATPSNTTQNITPTSGKYLSKVTINPIPGDYVICEGTLNISSNGEHAVSGYEMVNVDVPTGITPTGTLDITANGTHDVTNYASVNVNVSSSSGSGVSLDAITTLPTANKYNVGCYANVDNTIYKCVQSSGINLLGFTDTLIGKTIKLDIEALRTAGKLYEGGATTGTSHVYMDLVRASGSTVDAIRIDIECVVVNGVTQIKDIYYLYYPGNTSYKYHWYCYGKTSADNTTTNIYFDDNTITFTSDNVQVYNDCGYIKSTYQNDEWLEYLTIGDVTYNWVSQ